MVEIKLGNEEFALKPSKKTNFKNFSIFNDNCIASHMYRTKVKFGKPIYVGFSVLDHSELLMYKFCYDKLKKYDSNLNLLHMDIYSYFVEMKKKSYKIIKENSKEFDTSDYDNCHECCDMTNKKVIGKFKDKLNLIPLQEYCRLRLKMYSYIFEKEDKIKNPVRCKGIKKIVVS